MRSRKGFFVIKIDLEKAYDRMNWKFIENVLYEVGLTKNIVDLISDSISSASFHLLWNGETIEEFKPSYGLK